MTTSIRNFLVINLLLCVILITSLSLLTNLFLENRDLQGHLDNKLTESAFAIQAFMSQSNTPEELRSIQQHINSLSSGQYPFALHQLNKENNGDHEAFGFEVLDQNNQPLLRSTTPLPAAFTHAPNGLSQGFDNNNAWRIFVTTDPENKSKVVVAEKYNFRNLLAGHVSQESFFVMLISYPFLGLLIWIIISRGLSSLRKISEEVQLRAPDHLEPIDATQVPVEIKTIVEEWNKLFSRLQEAFAREKRFAADAAHELKTPLAALKAHTQVALNATSDAEREAALRKILTGVDRSAHVVQQLLTLSRMGHGLALEHTGTVNIVKQSQEVIAELAHEVLAKDSEIELISPEKEPLVQGHSTAIAILIRNLVDNAIRYTPAGSLVQVIIEESADKVLLKVIDNGPGIPEHLHQQVFERFFRMIGNKSPGSGLGLGIVQQIAEVHHAVISLSTAPSGQGLQVTVAFPKP
ncbi:MAG TPA: ATP-binding protein [Gammaproteobacteria bacterium]|nr:ATP-binding protein [Gammaproteobacteria bacterium]